MGGTEGQLAQVSPCLVPTFMVNTQHQVKHRPAGKPSYGNRHCRSKYFNYGSQTGRSLGAATIYFYSYGSHRERGGRRLSLPAYMVLRRLGGFSAITSYFEASASTRSWKR